MYRRNNQSLVLLAPVEIPFTAKQLQRKVLGFVMKKGSEHALIHALPGNKELPAHPRLLDNLVWVAEVRRMSAFHGFVFPTNGWELIRGEDRRGESFASHVEPKLMLFYACHLLIRLTKEALELKIQVAMLPRLLELTSEHTAEIHLSRRPCHTCKAFQRFMKRTTGIDFEFVIITNLGIMKETRDKRGNHIYENPSPSASMRDSESPSPSRESTPEPALSVEEPAMEQAIVRQRDGPQKYPEPASVPQPPNVSRKRQFQILEEEYDDYVPPPSHRRQSPGTGSSKRRSTRAAPSSLDELSRPGGEELMRTSPVQRKKTPQQVQFRASLDRWKYR